MNPRRFDIWLANLDPTLGSEVRDTRPCLVISPDTLNKRAQTVIIAPLTTGEHPYLSRIPCQVNGQPGHVILDQLRAIDQGRLISRLGHLDEPAAGAVLAGLAALFRA